MSEILALIIFYWSVYTLVLVRNVFHDTYIWQIKEYRLDRIISHLKFNEEPSSRNKYINIVQIAILVVSVIFVIFPNKYYLLPTALAFFTYTIESFNASLDLRKGKAFRPKKSIRNLLIVSFSSLVLILPILLPLNLTRNIASEMSGNVLNYDIETESITIEDFLLQANVGTSTVGIPLIFIILITSTILIITSDLISPLIVSLFVFATEPLSQYKRRKIIKKAKHKINNHKPFKVIAITGSYGKSTTKELLYELIKTNFNTAKTDKNYNSTVGIAMSINQNLKKNTEVFIAEMGAYKKGEISQSCSMLQPDISIVTGITKQHLNLFGNLENLIKAKYEIIKNLKKDGSAVLNAGNEQVLKMVKRTKKRKILYSVNSPRQRRARLWRETAKNIDLEASNIKKIEDRFQFDIKYKKKKYPVDLEFTGEHNIQNILASIAVALELGMDINTTIAKLQTIELPQIHLKWHTGINKSNILDDGYNTNPEGFKNAIKVVKEKKGRKILITKGIIELGKSQKEIYEKLVKEMYGVVNLVITSDTNLLEILERYKGSIMTIYARDHFDFKNIVKKNIKENDVVLIEGAMHPEVVEILITN